MDSSFIWCWAKPTLSLRILLVEQNTNIKWCPSSPGGLFSTTSSGVNCFRRKISVRHTCWKVERVRERKTNKNSWTTLSRCGKQWRLFLFRATQPTGTLVLEFRDSWWPMLSIHHSHLFSCFHLIHHPPGKGTFSKHTHRITVSANERPVRHEYVRSCMCVQTMCS